MADVIVCGAGPAGISAAIASARGGAKTLLIESEGCLGGVWTAGCLTWIIDHENKQDFNRELFDRLDQMGGRGYSTGGEPNSGFDPEAMKVLLETLCDENKVEVLLHTRVVAALRDPEGHRLTHIITESKAGRQAWKAKLFIDCTGDGDLGALAGCGFDMGRPSDGGVQPLSMLCMLAGLRAEEILPYISENGLPWGQPHQALLERIRAGGADSSYHYPTIFLVGPGLYCMMANHQYGVRCNDVSAITRATVQSRRSVWDIVSALRSLGGPWKDIRIVATSAQIGVREGRRLHGLTTVTADDVREGRSQPDAVCRATFCVDIHSVDPKKDKGLGSDGVTSKPYDIPLRALVAKDVDGLMMAGRCISGDFWAHASYRVTGNAVSMGQAAGRFAASCIQRDITPHQATAPLS
jgi:hypothetical protein